jgi:hypothetical protein
MHAQSSALVSIVSAIGNGANGHRREHGLNALSRSVVCHVGSRMDRIRNLRVVIIRRVNYM